MNRYLVRFAQAHEDFRLAELKAIATGFDLPLEVVDYADQSPFCIITLPSHDAARQLIARSVLAFSISHLWATATSHTDLHSLIQRDTSHLWPTYQQLPFRFEVDSYMSRHSQASKRDLINSFHYLNLQGPTRPSDPSVTTFVVSEEYALRGAGNPHLPPRRVFFSVHLADSARDNLAVYDLKRRHYISTTSMDAELAMVTANMALAGPGKVVYDPFCGTGSFLVAAAHFGASVVGSDMDGRVVRGRIRESKVVPVKPGKMAYHAPLSGTRRATRQHDGSPAAPSAQQQQQQQQLERSVRGNLGQYGLQHRWLDGFVSDLTNSPIRIPLTPPPTLSTTTTPSSDPPPPAAARPRFLDAIICDPPYGVREGLKVLGSHKPSLQVETFLADGTPAHLAPDYIPPRRAYGFDALLGDVLDFGARALVDGGRLAMWIPAENGDVSAAPSSSNANTATATATDRDRGNVEGGDGAEGAEARKVAVPLHPRLALVSVSTQTFTKWSRRLVVYRRLRDGECNEKAVAAYEALRRDDGPCGKGKGTADELNDFRRRFFEGFKREQ